ANNEQPCNVRAGDEQHEPNSRLQHEQDAPQVAEECRLERLQSDAASLLRTRILLGQLRVQRFDVGLRLQDRYAGFYAADDREHATWTARIDLERAERTGQPEVVIGVEDAGEAWRHHTDNDAGGSVEDQRLLQHVGIRGEAGAPQTIADDNRAIPKSDRVFVRREEAAKLRLHRERTEQRGTVSRTRQ